MKTFVKHPPLQEEEKGKKNNDDFLFDRQPKQAKKALLISLFFILLILFFLFDVALGSVKIPLREVIEVLLGNAVPNDVWGNIILKIRLPKAITALLVGASLSVCGLQMQTLFRNPLAGPSVLGITAGASLGVATIMLSAGMVTTIFSINHLSALNSWAIILAAIIGSGLVLLLVLSIASRVKDNVVLLLIGLMVSHITIAIVSLWQYFSDPEQIQDYIMWTFGSLGGVTESHLLALSIMVFIGLLLSFASSKSLNVLLLGENYAKSLGLSVNKSRVILIISTSLLAGSVTAFCGPIGFIGIAVPHISRALLDTSDHKILIPSVCLIGAILMLFCDIIAHFPGSQTVLPINAITSLIGAPVVIWVIIKRNNIKSSFS